VLEAQIKRRPAMKKVSTAAAKQSKNFSQQKLTIGLDLGDRNSWYCVVDEAGQIQLEQRVRTTAKALQEVFGTMPRSRIALEIGTHSPWISRMLSDLGHEVIVANARKVRLIGESRKKDDRLDAQTLARLARIDPELLYPVKHRSAQAQADLTVIRARAGLVRARTGLVNSARRLAKSYGERLRGCNVRNMNPEKADRLSPELQRALEPLLSAIAELSQRICEYNERIEAHCGLAPCPSRLSWGSGDRRSRGGSSSDLFRGLVDFPEAPGLLRATRSPRCRDNIRPLHSSGIGYRPPAGPNRRGLHRYFPRNRVSSGCFFGCRDGDCGDDRRDDLHPKLAHIVDHASHRRR
jgi:hypothetical protein